MKMPIVLRLLLGEVPVLRALVLGLVSFGVLIFVDQGRRWTMPITDPAVLALAREGSVAFLVGGLLGAILAGSIWEVRVAPFAWNLPGFARRTAIELRAAGVLVVALASVIGILLHGGDGHALLAAIAAALGFAVGVFNLDPPSSWNRAWQLPAMLAAALPVYFMAEIALAIGPGPWPWRWLWIALWLGGAVVLMFAAIAFNGAGRARSARHRLDHSAWPLEASADGSLGAMARRAPLDGADAFSGVRHSDGAWVRAILHETYGPVRGGMAGQAIGFAIVTLVMCVLVNLYFAADLSPAAGSAPGGADLTQHHSVSPAIVESFAEPNDREWERGRTFGAVFPVALILSIFTLGTPVLPQFSVVHPLSRARRARILWLMTLKQEALILVALLAIFTAAAALASAFGMPDPWRIGGLWMLAALAGWVVLPLGRWIRLRLIDAEGIASPAKLLDVRTPRFVLASCVNALAVVGGAFLVFFLWRATLELPTPARVAIVIASLAAIVGLRWLWLVVLVRFHARNDLLAS